MYQSTNGVNYYVVNYILSVLHSTYVYRAPTNVT